MVSSKQPIRPQYPDEILVPPAPSETPRSFSKVLCPSCGRVSFLNSEFVAQRAKHQDQFFCCCSARIHFRSELDPPCARLYAPAEESLCETSATCPDIVRSVEELIDWGVLFRTLYVDPPWSYQNVVSNGAAIRHYRCMSLDDICALPVSRIAAKDAHLHLWAPVPQLPSALRVVAAWGFSYRSLFAWVKPRLGTGNYYRGSVELLLFASRGKTMRFARRDVKNYLIAEPTEHSTKPDAVREIVEQLSPPPRVELFARRAAQTWVVMGDQIQRTLF